MPWPPRMRGCDPPRHQAGQRAPGPALGRARTGRCAGVRLRHLRRCGRADPANHRPDRHPAVHATGAHQPGQVRSSGRRVLHRRPAVRTPGRPNAVRRSGNGLQRGLPPRLLPPAADSGGRRRVGRPGPACCPRTRTSGPPPARRLRPSGGWRRDLPAPPRWTSTGAPEDFADVERPATVVRGAFTDDELTAFAAAPAVEGEVPELGEAGSATIVRPMPRREVRPAAEARTGSPGRQSRSGVPGKRCSWRRRGRPSGRDGGGVCGAGAPAAQQAAPTAAGQPLSAQLQDPALPTGLTISRSAAYRTHHRRGPPDGFLLGAESAAVRGLPRGHSGPGRLAAPARRPPGTAASVSRNQASITGLDVELRLEGLRAGHSRRRVRAGDRQGAGGTGGPAGDRCLAPQRIRGDPRRHRRILRSKAPPIPSSGCRASRSAPPPGW